MTGPGRPFEFARDPALFQCLEIFWCRGYEATSLDDLLRATGLSKSSFYNTFGSKKALFEESLKRYGEGLFSDLQNLRQSEPRALDFLARVLHRVAASAGKPEGRKGCLMVNTAIEFGLGDPAVSALMGRGMDRISGLFQGAIEQAQDQGDIPAGKKSGELVMLLHVGISGLRTMIKTGASGEDARAVAGHLLSALTSPIPESKRHSTKRKNP